MALPAGLDKEFNVDRVSSHMARSHGLAVRLCHAVRPEPLASACIIPLNTVYRC